MTIEDYYKHITAVLPACDMEDYPSELFMSFAEHGATLRKEWSWCAALSEEMFLSWVLCPRVNNEELSDCRGLFYEQLAPRVKGLSLTEAILEVNRWCAENVTYRSTDERTASALAVYRSGCGRCGEESVFAVNALRSVGIAARQVYAPWWSHCDDNHAWVEVFDGQRWRFMGACEPEPRLDMGWFVPATGRAMLCHTKCFVGDGGWEKLPTDEDRLDLDTREGVAYISVTQRYAKVRTFTVRVTDVNGNGLQGAVVEYYVLNEGLLRRIARRVTDSMGKAALNLGLGSIWVTARFGDMAAEALVNTSDADHIRLSLPGSTAASGSFDFVPPADSGVKAGGLSGEEKLRRQETRTRAKTLREKKHPGGGTEPDKPELWPWQRFAPGRVPELWRDGCAHDVYGPGRGTVVLRQGEGKGALGLMCWDNGWKAVPAPGFGCRTELPIGRYRLITSSRLPNGTQLAVFTDFTLGNGDRLELTADFRKGSPEDLLQKLPLPDVSFDWDGLALLCWIDPGAEPTEHLLGELRAAGKLGYRVHFIGKALDKLDGLPEGAVLHPWDDYAAETVARRVFLEPDNLPLVVLADGGGFGRFASAGYNVGLVELCAELCTVIDNMKEQ